MEDTGIMTRKPFEQHVANLPQEILKEPRFVFLGKNVYTDASWVDKAPEPNWQSPRKQRLYSDINGFVSFVATTPEFGGFIFYDLNKVLDENGNFVNETAENWYKTLHVPGTYCEKSMSGRGLHMFAKTTTYDVTLKGTFEIPLDPNDPDCKLRVFFGTSMTCIVTGDCFNCAPNTPIPQNEVADAVYMKVLTAANVKLPEGMALAEASPDIKPMHAKTAATSGKVFRDNLSKSELERIKNDLRDIPPDEVAQKLHIDLGRKNGFVCPECGNGSGKDGTGVKPRRWSGHWEWHCHGCEKSWDNIELLASYLGKSTKGQEFWEVIKKGAEMFHIGYTVKGDYVTPDCLKTPPPPEKEYTPKDYTNFYNNVARPGLDKFLRKFPNGQWRGLTRKTLEYFFCGYVPEFGKAKAPAVIVPYSVNHYFARFVGDKSKLSKKQQDALREKYHTVGSKPIFNAKHGLDTDKPVFVVESATDAMSIYQAGGYNVIAVSGSSLTEFMREQLKPYIGKKFIVMLDGDATGQKKKQGLVNQLRTLGHAATSAVLSDVHKDANDFLQADADGLAARLKDIYDDAQKFFDNPAPPTEKPKTINLNDHSYAETKWELPDDAPESNPAFDPAVDEWQEINGTISPAMLSMLLDAKKYLDALTVDKITSAVAQSSKTKSAVALCKFYDCFIDSADNFLANLSTAKRNTKAKIKQLSVLGGQLAENPPAELVALSNVSLTELTNNIKTLFNTYKKAHKAFQEYERKRKAQEERAAKQEAQLMKVENAYDRLGKLKALPKTPERDKAIIETIKELCSWRLDSHDNPIKIEATQQNLDLIFENDPNLDGVIAYDEFYQCDVFKTAPPWKHRREDGDDFAENEWNDHDDKQLRVYLRRTYAEFSDKDLTDDTLTDFSRRNSFHVIRDYFNGLPKWDGKPRAETLFIDWLKVDDTPFARAATINWLIAAVARPFHPGCRYQQALVLPGAQGIGKSFILERLGKNWHVTLSDSIDDSHALDTTQKSWILELKEGAAWRKADADAQKRFIDTAKDTRRVAYAHRATTFRRQNVIAITINDKQFLSDMTGNRRYMILESKLKARGTPGGGHIEEVRGERLTDDNIIDQIWAEVFARYNEMFAHDFDEAKLELRRDMQIQLENITQQFMRDDGTRGIIQAALDKKILPKVIWDLMSIDERRDFHVTSSFTIDEEALIARFEASGRITAAKQATFDAAKTKGQFVHRYYERNPKTHVDNTYLTFYGTTYRQHICAAEICAEVLGKGDKRGMSSAVLEILSQTEGWTLGKRISHDPVYGCQKNVFYRDADNSPEDKEPIDDETADVADNHGVSAEASPVAQPVDEWQGEPVAPDDVPFDINPQHESNEPVILPDDDDTPF